MADDFCSSYRKTSADEFAYSAGTGNGMGNIMTAFQNKTPLIITAGQQTREMILCDPPNSSGITPTFRETTFPKVLNSCKSPMTPYDGAAAIVGDSLLADAKLALEALNDAISEPLEIFRRLLVGW